MDIFLVNSDHPHAKSLAKKLAERAIQGAIIPLNTQEMELYCSDDFQHVSYGHEGNPMITEIDPGGHYLFACDPSVNIDDVMRSAVQLDITIGIVRTDRRVARDGC